MGSPGFWSILLAAVIWGTVGIGTRALYGFTDATPASVGFLRLAVAAPALLLAAWGAARQRLWQAPPRDAALMAVIGVSMAAYQICYFTAITYVGVTIAALVTLCTPPVMVAVLSALIWRERVTARVGVALAAAIGGTLLLVAGDDPSPLAVANLLAGVGLALGSAFSYSLLTLASRPLAGRYPAVQPIALGFTLGALLLLPYAVFTDSLVLNYPLAGWLIILHLGLLPTALGYGLFVWGLKTTSPTVASILTLGEPLTSAALAAWLFEERLGAASGLGALLLLAALLALLWPAREKA